MMNEKKFDITELQWISLIVGAMVGIGITTLPRELAEEAGRDGWITLLVSTIIVLIYAKICIYYAKLFPEMTLAESVQLVLGKWLGGLVVILYSIYTFSLGAIVLRSFMEIIHVYFAITSPAWFKMIVPLIIIIYMSRCGMATLSRMAEIVFMITIPAIFLLAAPVRQGNLMHMLPVFEQGIAQPFLALPVAIFAFLGVETVILVFYPYLEKKETVNRVTYMAVILVGFLYTGISLITLLVLGLEQIQLFYWPFVEAVKIVRVVILERIDNIFLYLWGVKVTMVASILYFSGTFSLSVLTKKNYHDIWAIVCWPVIYVISLYPETQVDLENISSLFTLWGGIFVAVLPIMLIVVAKIRKVGGKENKGKSKNNKKAS